MYKILYLPENKYLNTTRVLGDIGVLRMWDNLKLDCAHNIERSLIFEGDSFLRWGIVDRYNISDFELVEVPDV